MTPTTATPAVRARSIFDVIYRGQRVTSTICESDATDAEIRAHALEMFAKGPTVMSHLDLLPYQVENALRLGTIRHFKPLHG